MITFARLLIILRLSAHLKNPIHEDEVRSALEKSKEKLIDAFEKLKSNIDDNWLETDGS